MIPTVYMLIDKRGNKQKFTVAASANVGSFSFGKMQFNLILIPELNDFFISINPIQAILPLNMAEHHSTTLVNLLERN
jgi:hypothetical protein